jgi:hypothetical protein
LTLVGILTVPIWDYCMSDAPEALPNPNASGHELPPEVQVSVDPESLARHYERDDVDTRSLLRFAIALGAGIVLALGVLWVTMQIWLSEPLPSEVQVAPAEVTVPAVPGPGLDAAPERRLDNYLQQEDTLLNNYGWIDRAAGTVHIPISQAMQLMVEQGVPAREGDAPDFDLPPAFRMDSNGGIKPVGEDAK